MENNKIIEKINRLEQELVDLNAKHSAIQQQILELRKMLTTGSKNDNSNDFPENSVVSSETPDDQ